MFFGLPEKDTTKEDVQRQKFVHGLVRHLAQVPQKNTSTNTSKNDVILSNILDPVSDHRSRSSRLDELKERIKRVQEKLDVTEEKIKESETSKKQLSEKLKMLENKISPVSILAGHPTQHGVAEWNRLTQALKEAEERTKMIKELEVKERTIREGFARVEKLLTKTASCSSLPP